MTSNRSLIWIGAGILALVVLGGAVVLLAEGRQDETFAPDSPQAAIQEYLAAWEAGNYEGAYAFFSSEVQADTSLDDYESESRSYAVGAGYGSRAAFIDEVEGDDQRVIVHLTVEEFYGGGPGTETFRSPRQVRMVHEADGWKIDDPLIWLDPTQFGEFPL